MCHGSTRQPISLAAVTASSGHCWISPLMSSLMEQVSSSSVISLVSRLFSSQYCISRITDSRQR